jgi:predicted dehydrogenase
MSKKSIIVGMGIGNLYKSVLSNLGHSVTTVDINPEVKADFLTIEDAVKSHGSFDTAHICTPNFLHEDHARQLAPYSKILFVEKPGLKTAEEWIKLVSDFPTTRFMMVKNNQWRSNINELKKLAENSKTIYIDWMNRDRVPNPGTWFTTKDLAFGGVSRDLMPHLLSLFMAMNPDYMCASELERHKNQAWQLSDLTNTDYGKVNPNGTYDVDDYFRLNFKLNDQEWDLIANWRTMDEDFKEITFLLKDGNQYTFELGLCPEDAYQAMIKDAVENTDNNLFWNNQLIQDYWIHKKIQ